MNAIPLVKPCRKCGSDDIALYQARRADYICRSCKKTETRKKYVENRDAYLERSKISYQSTSKPCGSKAWASTIIAQYKYRDKQKLKHPVCDIKPEFLLSIIKKNCFYCDDTIDQRLVDRIDNQIGHVESNLVPSCYSCNSTRMDNWTHQEMKILGKAVKEIKNIRRAL